MRLRVLILMGPSGCGKSSLGLLVSSKWKWKFIEGDDYHSEANIEKMRSGQQLTDLDRYVWLSTLRMTLLSALQTLMNSWNGIIMTCSALKYAYRNILIGDSLELKESIVFVYIHVPREELLKRLQKRTEHFFCSSLLDSQLQILQPPNSLYEYCCQLDGLLSTMELLQILQAFVTKSAHSC